MNRFVCMLGLSLVCSWGAQRGDKVEYVGGTLASLPRDTGRLEIADGDYLRFSTGGAAVQVAYDSVNLLEYGQNVGRRYAMAIVISPILVLSKKRQHFLTIGYTDDVGRQQALVFRVGKGQIRALLASLEARTGRKVQYQDQEARKAR